MSSPWMLLQVLNHIFEGTDEKTDQLSICGLTYVIKVRPSSVAEPGLPRFLVAFSGSKYILVCRSLTKYIVVQTDGRRGEEWLNSAVKWLTKLGQKLIDKKYWEEHSKPGFYFIISQSQNISYLSFIWGDIHISLLRRLVWLFFIAFVSFTAVFKHFNNSWRCSTAVMFLILLVVFCI